MEKEQPIVVVERGGYGEAIWYLSIPPEGAERRRTFYLGQDVKFISRVLGMSVRQFIEEVCAFADVEPEHPQPWTDEFARNAAQYLIEEFGGIHAVRKLEDWGLAAQ